MRLKAPADVVEARRSPDENPSGEARSAYASTLFPLVWVDPGGSQGSPVLRGPLSRVTSSGATKGGWNPLYIATDNRNIEGGDYPTRKPDMDHLEIIEKLLERGADVNTRMKSSTETRTIFTHQWLHEEGATPFLRAAQSGDVTLMRLLLEHGADPLLATEDETTSLMVAAGIGWVEGVTYEWSPAQTLEAVNLLLDLGLPVNAQNLDGQTALMGAAHKGRTDVVQTLVDRRADLALHDIGSRDTIHVLAGLTWQAIDYADGLVRVGVQSAIPHPETAALIRRLMGRLDERYRRMIELRYYEEMSYEEIAQRLQLPIGTVKAQLYRAKENLYELLQTPQAGAHLERTRRVE